MITLTYHDLELHHAGETILERIDLEFRGPGVCALLGPSGVGKSSLLRTTQRLIEDGREGWQRRGDVRFNGQSIFSSKINRQQVARQIGFIQQNPVMLAGSVLANVEFALKHTTSHGRREIRRMAEEALERVGLASELPNLNFSARKLSGGQAQRLATARAVALDPQVLLMDEPTTSLDPLKAERVEQIIQSIAAERLVVLVTHDVQLAARIADFAAFMFRGESGGRIIESGVVPAVVENPKAAIVRDFVRTGRQLPLQSALPTALPRVEPDADEMIRTTPEVLARVLRAALLMTGSKKSIQRLYLFVCGGNTFRSPLAQAFCSTDIARLLDIPHNEIDRFDIRAQSAGLSAQPGALMTSMARDALDQLGTPSPHHTSRHVTQSLVEQADVIVCMTHGQCKTLAERFPAVASKILRLDPNGDIPDHDEVSGDNLLSVARHVRHLVRQHMIRDLMAHLASA